MMDYKTLSMKEAKLINKCDGDCVYGFAGEHTYHCKYCLGVKDISSGEFTKVGETGSEFDHATTVPTHVWKQLWLLCNKGKDKVWIR